MVSEAYMQSPNDWLMSVDIGVSVEYYHNIVIVCVNRIVEVSCGWIRIVANVSVSV